jgi:acetoacetyl-CoA synthetase
MSEPLWRPSLEAVEQSQLSIFTRWLSDRTGENFEDYHALHNWTVKNPGQFWRSYWQFSGLIASRFDGADVENLNQFPGARWFPDLRMNFAENLLAEDSEKIAFISILENGSRRTTTYHQLRTQTAQIANALSKLGVVAGDRIAGWLPNTVEAASAMLATSSLGAIWSSCSPDFGAPGALDRFGQIGPKVLIACNGYFYGGKTLQIVDKVRSVVAAVPSIETVVWVDVLGEREASAADQYNLDLTLDLNGEYDFQDWVRDEPTELAFTQLPFDHPLYILYSSGTTGKPKCIVHGQGGTLIQHRKEHQMHVDLRPEDTLFFFTTCGWMMWNWLISALATRCTIVLFDGAPTHPRPSTMFDICEQENVTVFGISAKFLSNIQKQGVKPKDSHDLQSMRMLISTGSPLTQEGFEYVYRDIKTDCHLVSMSGGTDIVSCFMLGNPNLPVYEGELQSPGLGMAVEIWNDEGEAIVGEKGELVCTLPFPSAPIGFWDDPQNTKYRDAYFSRHANIWLHGDYAEQTANGGYIIHGRSDAILNPGGVRIGTAEIYRQVEFFDQVSDAVCVGQNWQDDMRVVLFVALKPGVTLDDALTGAIKLRIRNFASPRHTPAIILQVDDIPRTMSGKIAELAVRSVIHNEPVKNTTALANPEALALYENLEALKS